MVTARTPARRAAIWISALVVIGQSSCRVESFAPQDASIVVRLAGLPNDPEISVSAFVKDLGPPYNRQDKVVSVGGEVEFDNLGAGFDIQVGVANLAPFGCRIARTDGIVALGVGTSIVEGVHTTPGSVDTVAVTLFCRAGMVDVVVSGLPAGERALVDLVSPGDTEGSTILAGTGHTMARVFPDQRVSVEPQRLIVGGRVYQAPQQIVSVASRQTTTAMVAYAPVGEELITTTTVTVVVAGVPADTGIVLRGFIDQGGHVVTGSIPLGGAATFTNVTGNFPVRAGLTNLGAYGCTAVGASGPPFAIIGDTVVTMLTPRPAVPDTAAFQVRCQSATLDLTVAGLPASATAQISVRSPVDSAIPRLQNGVTRLALIPHDAVRITPAPFTGADGRVYLAPPQTIALPSRQTTNATVQYSAAAAPTCVDRPVAWYPFDGDATDASGNGNHGSLIGTIPVADHRGTAASALLFNGVSNVVNLGDRFNTLALPFSVAMWTFRQGSSSEYGYVQGEYRSLFVTDDQPNWYAGIFFQVSPTGTLQINYASGGPIGPGARRSFDSDAPIPSDTWVHVAATVRGPTDMTLYVNGVAVPGTYSGSGGALAHSSFPARIGSFSFIPANMPWYGRLDDVRLYDCSLSASEVASLVAR